MNLCASLSLSLYLSANQNQMLKFYSCVIVNVKKTAMRRQCDNCIDIYTYVCAYEHFSKYLAAIVHGNDSGNALQKYFRAFVLVILAVLWWSIVEKIKWVYSKQRNSERERERGRQREICTRRNGHMLLDSGNVFVRYRSNIRLGFVSRIRLAVSIQNSYSYIHRVYV